MPRTKVAASMRASAAELGAELRRRRETAGFAREALARRAGLSTETIRKLETASSITPEFFTVARLCGALGLSIDELMQRILPGATDTFDT